MSQQTPTFTPASKDGSNIASPAAWKSALSLGNVDNTSDANKPVSSAVQTALDLKAPKTDLVAGSKLPAYLSIPHPYTGVDPTSVNSVNHPTVVDLVAEGLPNGIGGWRYVMAFTPYVGINPQLYENPCAVVSNDKINWVVPSGLTNPLATNAQAVTAGFDYWSDPELLWDGAKLIMFYRGGKSGVNDKIYARTTTDLVNWTAQVAVVTAGSPSSMLSPTVIKEPDGTFTMWVCDSGTGAVYRRTCATALGTWSAATACKLPRRTGVWHCQVRYYQGVYYLLLSSGLQDVNNRPHVSMHWGTDGITFRGDASPFLGITGTAMDAYGNYRCAMIPRGGFPATFDVWATGIETPSSQWRIFYQSRQFQPKSRRDKEGAHKVSIHDYFLGGNGGTTDNALIGDLGWVMKNATGAGKIEPGLKGNTTLGYGIGGVRITTAASSGAATGIKFAGGPWNYSMYTDNFKRLSDNVWTVHFSLQSTAAGDTVIAGFGVQHMPSTAPGRFVGLRTVKGTDTNFKFYMVDLTYDPVTVDLGVPLDTGYHRFQMCWDDPTNSWLARIDERPWTVIPNTGVLASDHVTPVETLIGNVQVSPTIYVVSGTAAAAVMDVEHVGLEGYLNQY